MWPHQFDMYQTPDFMKKMHEIHEYPDRESENLAVSDVVCVCENKFWLEIQIQIDDLRVEWALKTAVMLPQLPKRSVTVSYSLGGGQLFPDAI